MSNHGGGRKQCSIWLHYEQTFIPDRMKPPLLSMLLVSLGSMGHLSSGAVFPWPSPGLSSLDVHNQTLTGHEITLTPTEKDMTGSMVSAGSLLGAWGAGYVVTTIGRRRSLQVVVVPFVIGWLMNALAPHVNVLLSARFILGIACGGTSVAASTYVMELSDTNVRGMMSTIPTFGIVLGGLYTVALGYLVHWHYLALLCLVPVAMLMAATFVLPDSPSLLIIKGRKERAKIILQGLRGPYADVDAEVKELEQRNIGSSKKSGYRSLLTGDTGRRLGVVLSLFFFQQFCGNYVFMIYTSRVLKNAGSSLDPDAATIIVAVVRVIGTVVAIVLMDRVGRRVCLISSHALNAMVLILLGVFVYLEEAAGNDDSNFQSLSWVPLMCVILEMFAVNMGAHCVPYTLATEYFPTSIRAQ
ncbi:unnamed protein product, partial [Meganyctiphanes norvegica]